MTPVHKNRFCVRKLTQLAHRLNCGSPRRATKSSDPHWDQLGRVREHPPGLISYTLKTIYLFYYTS